MNNIPATIENFKNKIINNKHTNLIHTGYKDLDYFLAQLESGSLITIGGRPCMGKSTFSYSLINNILEFNKKLVLFSTKTKKEKIVPRLIAEKSKIDINKIYSGKPYDIKTIIKCADFYKDKDLNIIDTARLTIHDIKNDIIKYQPDIIFLDDIQSMYISQNKETLNEIVKELKQIALGQNLIIFITPQLSRCVEKRYNIELDNIRGFEDDFEK